MRIYIVDDDHETNELAYKANFKTIVEYLITEGHSVACEAYLENAYNHLIDGSNKFKYDLIVVDHKFPDKYQSGRFVNGRNEQEKDNGTGAFLCGELSKNDLPTPIVLFTATGKDPDNIRKVLGDYGICYFFDKLEFNNDAIIKTTTLPGFKRIWTIRQHEIEKELKVYFRNLSDKQLKAFEDECKKGLNADWKKQELSIELEGGNYMALELLSDPFSVVDVSFVNDKIEAFIARYKRHYKFFGKKMDTEHVYTFLKNYLEASNYENKLQEINIQALNYMLNVLHIREKMEDIGYNGGVEFQLNIKNRTLKGAIECNSEARFYEKLILRRVALGFQILVGFESANFFTKKTLAALMRHGTTTTLVKLRDKQKNKEEEISTTHTFGTGLGLNVENSTGYFITSDNCILKEELDWIQNFGKAAIEIREYLNTISTDASIVDVKDNVRVTQGSMNPGVTDTSTDKKISFSDFDSFQEHIQKLKRKGFPTFTNMIRYEKDIAEKELVEPTAISLILDFYNTQ